MRHFRSPPRRSQNSPYNLRDVQYSEFDHWHLRSHFATHLPLITDGPLLENKNFREMMESYDTRVARVKQFLTDLKPSLNVICVRLLDLYGTRFFSYGSYS